MKYLLGQPITPENAMRLALAEARMGTGRVSPNPLVGCVIVDRDHEFLATGYHVQVGQAHAEVDALNKVENRAKLDGAHVYVTLEPCAHQGRTPSCAKTLSQLKLGSVTYALEDPNPLVAGQGAEILKQKGIRVSALKDRSDLPQVVRDELIGEAEDVAEVFLHNMRAREPFVAVKIAATLDGQMALKNGQSQWITGEEARLHAHGVRAQYDAVAVGRGTFVADNPSLNVRHPQFMDLKNKVILFDPNGKTLNEVETSKIFRVRDPQQVLVVTRNEIEIKNQFPFQILRIPFEKNGEFDLSALNQRLYEVGVTSFMIEGGAKTIGAFFKQQKVQRLHLYQAPSLIGGEHGMSWSRYFGVSELSAKLELKRVKFEMVSPDFYFTGRF